MLCQELRIYKAENHQLRACRPVPITVKSILARNVAAKGLQMVHARKVVCIFHLLSENFWRFSEGQRQRCQVSKAGDTPVSLKMEGASSGTGDMFARKPRELQHELGLVSGLLLAEDGA